MYVNAYVCTYMYVCGGTEAWACSPLMQWPPTSIHNHIHAGMVVWVALGARQSRCVSFVAICVSCRHVCVCGRDVYLDATCLLCRGLHLMS